jgi:hypothetical protein
MKTVTCRAGDTMLRAGGLKEPERCPEPAK